MSHPLHLESTVCSVTWGNRDSAFTPPRFLDRQVQVTPNPFLDVDGTKMSKHANVCVEDLWQRRWCTGIRKSVHK